MSIFYAKFYAKNTFRSKQNAFYMPNLRFYVKLAKSSISTLNLKTHKVALNLETESENRRFCYHKMF